MVYKIGSFNLMGLQQTEDRKQDFNIIANIIKDERPKVANSRKSREKNPFHIVALQEVVNETQFNIFKDYYLGSDQWDGYYGKPNSWTNHSAKGYAFVWQKKCVNLMWGEEKKYDLFKPHILTELEENKVKMDLAEIAKLTRRPLYARFNLGNSTELRLLNTHITFGRSDKMKEEYRMDSDALQRKLELKILTETVYPAINKFVYKNGYKNYYTIMLGDYNLNLSNDWTKGTRVYDALAKKHPEIIKSLPSGYRNALKLALYETLPKIESAQYEEDDQKIITVQDQLTTLKKELSDEDKKKNRVINTLQKKGMMLNEEIIKLAEAADSEYQMFHSNYDHFTYDVNRFEGVKIIGPYRLDDVITDFFEAGIKGAEEYRKKVSDHIPIAIEIDLRNGR